MITPVLRIVGLLCLLYLVFAATVYLRQRSMLFLPGHGAPSTTLAPWQDGTNVIGYCREVAQPHTIWLMTHGNAGQAADRDYVLPCLSDQDSLYVLEYPGYGVRKGSPSLVSMNQAAVQGYRLLRAKHPKTPVCALGESIGCGPSCALVGERPPPDKLVLVVPFDSLVHVASKKFPFLPVRLMIRDPWDNVEALRHYSGPVDIIGARDDVVIPIAHAKALAGQVSQAHFIQIEGGHNDWAAEGQVRLRR